MCGKIALQLLDYKRSSLEKVISSRRFSYPSFNNYNNSLSESLSVQGTTSIPIYSPNNSLQDVLTPIRHTSIKKCSSTPRKAERLFDLDDRHTLVSKDKSIAFLPRTVHSNYSPNIVQDISYDEDFLMSQSYGSQKTTYNNLQKELMQVQYQV